MSRRGRGLASFVLLGATLIASAGLPASRACAHEVRPAYLQITEEATHRIDVLWKRPVVGAVAVRLTPHLSAGWLDGDPAQVQTMGGFQIKVWRIQQAESALAGQTLSIEGLEHTLTDVLVDITLADGQRIHEILKPGRRSLVLRFEQPATVALQAYLTLGIEHILTGFDHLMFVLGLMLLVADRWQLIKTITAFTAAHSITLACAALSLIRVQPAIVESLVALSIVFLASELVRIHRGPHSSLTTRCPWLIATAFGLLHGLAFAGALTDIGLPPRDIPLALFLFNLGVEIGQLVFVAAALSLSWLLRQLPRPLPAWSRWIPPYAIGSCAMVWFIERVAVVIM